MNWDKFLSADYQILNQEILSSFKKEKREIQERSIED